MDNKVENKNRLNIAESMVLTLLALAHKGRDTEEEYKPWAVALAPEVIGTAAYNRLLELKMIDNEGVPTSFGMKLVLNGTSPTPNFKALAESEFNVALRMFFTSQGALQEGVAKSEKGEIVPKVAPDGNWVDTRLCDNLLAVRDWINAVTQTYQNSLVPTEKPVAKAAKSSKK